MKRLRIFLGVALLCLSSYGGSLRFYGSGINDSDRVKISIDPHRAADVGGADFTAEFWIKAQMQPAQGNPNSGTVYDTRGQVTPGTISGNLILDRDIFGAGDQGKYWVSMGIPSGGASDKRVIGFGINVGSVNRSFFGTNHVANNQWRHIAVTRQNGATSSVLSIFVDGILDARATDAPLGDVSYRNGRSLNTRTPLSMWPFNTGTWDSEPYLVLGAEKHDYDQYADGGATPSSFDYPAYNGLMDELRLSTVARYTGTVVGLRYFNVSPAAWGSDGQTAALYHFDESSGTNIVDTAAGSSHGLLRPDLAGRSQRSSETPFGAVSSFWFRAVALTNQVVLRWSDPRASGMQSDTVHVRCRTDSYPSSTSDGQAVYTGTNRFVEHAGLMPLTTYYYTIWVSHDGVTFVSPP